MYSIGFEFGIADRGGISGDDIVVLDDCSGAPIDRNRGSADTEDCKLLSSGERSVDIEIDRELLASIGSIWIYRSVECFRRAAATIECR